MRTQMLLVVGAIALGSLAAFVFGQVGVYPAPDAVPSGAAPGTQQPAAFNRFVLPATEVPGIGVAEVSGLAWDADEKLLYAASDQGYVYHFRIQLDGQKIASIKPVFAAALVDPKTGEGKASSGKHFNAEGLAVRHGDNGIRGDSEFIVALEEDRPQIARFSPAGTLLRKLPVPSPANDIANYQKKSRGLESVALHRVFGLMTAPEAPFQTRPAGQHTIYANGHECSFPRHAEGSRLKGLDVLPDGNLLVLERSRYGSKDSQTASLRRVDLTTCCLRGACKTALLTTLPPGPENIEGMTLLDAHHALLASDSGGDTAQGTTFVLIVLP